MGGCSHKLLPPVTPGTDPGCPKVHDIFISHHHSSDPKDLVSDFSQHFAEWIFEVCVRLGLKTFLDKTNLSRILNEQGLRTEVFSSHVLVAIVSKDGLIDPNGMQQELIWAHNGAIPIVPFYDGDRFSPEAYASWQREFAFALKRPAVVYHRSLHLRAERALLEAVHKALKDAPGCQLPQELVSAIQRSQAKAKRAAALASAGSSAEVESAAESTKSQRQSRPQHQQPQPSAPAIRSTSAIVGTAGRPAEAGNRQGGAGNREGPKRFRFEEGLKDNSKEAEGGVARLMKSLRDFTATEDEQERKPFLEASADEPGPFIPKHKTLKPSRGILKGSGKPAEAKAGGNSAKNPTGAAAVPRVMDKHMEQGIARLREYLSGLRKTDTAQLPTVLRVLHLMQPNEDVTKCALAVVFEFVQDTAACRQVVAQLGGIKSIIAVMALHSQNTTLQTYGCGCLYALSCFRPDNPQKDNNSAIIAHSGGIGRLTDAMVAFPIVHEVQQWGVGALRHLAVEIGNNRREVSDGGEVQLTMRSINKRMIAKTGGIELIAKAMLRFPDDIDLQENGCAALCNLTSNRQDNKVRAARAGCIRAAISAMRTFPAEPDLMQLACALLRSLALGVPENKIAIVAQGGVRELCQAMAKNRNNAEVNAQAVAALCNLTSQVAENKHAICQAGGLELAVAALRAMPGNVELQQQGCGLLHNLACEPALKAQVCAAGGTQVADVACESGDRSVQQLGNLLKQQLRETGGEAAAEMPSEVQAESPAKDLVGKRRRRKAAAQQEETDETGAGINGLFTLRKPGSRGAQSKALTRPQRKVMADLLESMREDPTSWLPNNNSSDEAKASVESSPVQSEASEGWGATRRSQAAEYGVEDLEGLSERSRISDRSRPSGNFDFFVRRQQSHGDGEPQGSARESESEVDVQATEGRAKRQAARQGGSPTVTSTPAAEVLGLELEAGTQRQTQVGTEAEAEAEAEEEDDGLDEALDRDEVEENESEASGRDLDTVSQVSSEASDHGWVDIFEDSDATKRIRRRIRRDLGREAAGGEGAALLERALNEERLELERQVELERAQQAERARAARVKKSKSQVTFAKALRGCGEAPPERWGDILRLQEKAAKRSPLKVAVADSAAAAAAVMDGLDGLARNAAKGLGRTKQKASAGLEAVGSAVVEQLQPQRPELEDDEGSIFGIDGLRELGEAEVALLDALGSSNNDREDAQAEGPEEQPGQSGKAGELQALSTRLEQRREERRRVKLL